MKRNITIVTAVLIGIAMTSSVIAARESKLSNASVSVQASPQTSVYSIKSSDQAVLALAPVVNANVESPSLAKNEAKSQSLENTENKMIAEKKITDENKKTIVAVSVQPKSRIVSRGGNPPEEPSSTKKTSSASNSSKFEGKDVELLDWWKSARYVFTTGSVATVKDVYTGRTFKIKRTMGTNHADCEALTREDADIIKDIWGGYSWDVRPVHIYVDGRVLAASMSGMPHAGVDSAPAFATVNNRSEGYGRGENLDTIKDNGMNGHFDVHFLNSTRHKDGQEDPRHQSAIKVAASR